MQIKMIVNLGGAYRWDEDAKAYVCYCPALNIYSQCLQESEVKNALQSTIMLYLETCWSRGILESVLSKAGFRPSAEGLTPRELHEQYIKIETQFPRLFDMDIPLHLIAAAQGLNNGSAGTGCA